MTVLGQKQPMWYGINAIAGVETDIKGGMERSAKNRK
jgi:hypothetical protein